MDKAYDQAQQLRTEKTESKREIHDKMNFTEQQLLLLTQEMKDKIRHMVEDVEQKVSCFLLMYMTEFC
jgi:mitofusin